jgi:phosphatidylserine/phosphatidylglycerophosphate/cardiolipin synthase-like enzyme
MSTAFTTPLTHGTALSPFAQPFPPPRGRFAADPLLWIGVPSGTVIKAIASGAIAAFQGASNVPPLAAASPWTLFELSPLPQFASAAFKALRGGLPLQYVLVGGTIASPATDDMAHGGDTLATAPAGPGSTAFLAVARQDRRCRDPLTWAEEIAATGSVDGAWTQFVTDLAALAGARTLRILDHIGRPRSSGIVGVAIDANPPVGIDLSLRPQPGDTGVIVPASSQASITFQSATAPIVAAVAAPVGVFTDPLHPLPQPLQLPPGARLAQLLDADAWFATRDDKVTDIPRWRSASHIEPIVDGNPYFARLVDDIRSAKNGGAVDFAGWAFVLKGNADFQDDWPLIPGANKAPNDTRLVSLVNELITNNAQVKFLVNQFLQFDAPSLDDFAGLTGILFALYGALMPFNAYRILATDPAGFCVGILAITAAGVILSTGLSLDLLKSLAEYSKDMVAKLNGLRADIATWTPYPAAFADNPLVPQPLKILGFTIDDLHHLGVYHQKLVGIRTGGNQFLAYLGGIDINSDRIDDPNHRAIHPFHDVQARVTGPAAGDVIQTIASRAKYHNTQSAVAVPASINPITDNPHLVQIGRTYYKPEPTSGSKPFDFAPSGETTTIKTVKQAIEQARDFIYIEEQYFTPPDDYVQALLDAATPSRGVSALIITVPYQTDQPYGAIRRSGVLGALAAPSAWGTRLLVGTPFRRFLHPTPALRTNLGRMRLATALGAGDVQATVSPDAHVPEPPFWAFVGNELLMVEQRIGAPASGQQTVSLVRAGGVDPRWGAQPLAHPIDTPVICVQLPGIYVHAKLMIVDDVFVSVGSSNLNRRGFYHDGETNAFAVPLALKSDPTNPARLLRARLWAEHLGLPPEMGLSLFADPLSAIPYFKTRSWYAGSRHQPLSFLGSTPPDISLSTSDSIGSQMLWLTVGAARDAAKGDLWRSLVDPGSASLPAPLHDGPEYP